jgi:hypothetical protein
VIVKLSALKMTSLLLSELLILSWQYPAVMVLERQINAASNLLSLLFVK